MFVYSVDAIALASTKFKPEEFGTDADVDGVNGADTKSSVMREWLPTKPFRVNIFGQLEPEFERRILKQACLQE